MAKETLHTLQGSIIRKGFGVQALRRDQAVLRGVVRGMTSADDLEDALTQAQTDLPATVSLNGRTLPLKAVEVRRSGVGTATVRATYNFTFTGSPASPSDDEFTDIQYSTGYEFVPVYRSASTISDSTGLPTGEMLGGGESYTVSSNDRWPFAPYGQMWSVTRMRITIFGEDTDAPDIAYLNATNHINGASQDIADLTFPIGTLRLDGLQVTRIQKIDDSDGTSEYRYVYAARYTADALGFQRQALLDDGPQAGGYEHSYYTEDVVSHPTYKVAAVGAALPVPSVAV